MSSTPSNPTPATILTHLGRHPDEHHGLVNTPVTRGSTILFKSLDDLEYGTQPFRYARRGTPISRDVEEVITALEQAEGTVLAPSGLAAISVAILSCVRAGGHILMTDNAYQPTRHFCETVLKRMNVAVTYFDPGIGGGIKALFTPQTKAILVESPGSLTFEMADLPAISKEAAAANIRVIADNSWATPLYHQPLTLGADIVVHAGTKMFVGHSDAMFGTASASGQALKDLRATHGALGICASPDDCFLAARGLRTLHLRMAEHSSRSIELATWLAEQKGILKILHPGLPGHPDHALYLRDFTGSGSIFGVILTPRPRENLAAMVDHLSLFGMGYSWGGFESLILPSNVQKIRTAVPWDETGTLLRIHVGFEDMNELKVDLLAALSRYLAD